MRASNWATNRRRRKSPTPPMSQKSPPSPPPTPSVIGEVRYSLPQLLAELEAERASGSFAMEKLDQTEIGKMFKSRQSARRAKRKD